MGIDEGWEGCGQGVNKTQHDANGNPVINTYRFPDMAKLVEFGHNAGVKMGWCVRLQDRRPPRTVMPNAMLWAPRRHTRTRNCWHADTHAASGPLSPRPPRLSRGRVRSRTA